MPDPTAESDPVPTGDRYVVVARRYRPQVFDELVGQEHVAQALSNAIDTNRVGHAYLFTGARGVGKTSAARILAKALNCRQGPAPVPCNQCEICLSIGTGDDVDVLEIDGASNRGIDEIRQLRQNAGVRPSRCRFKIYIIDEVHMLTREAFNALLKTLEEPPAHVKFIFCTTEPTKIPVTILSRCQRFDFAGISTASIAHRLRQIVDAERVEADDDALDVLARRATGSMRDSQSLLEQLLAFAPGRITLDDVHGMLGTAGRERLDALVGHLVGRDAAAAIADLDAAVGEGVDVALLIEQLLGHFRDCMVTAAGCSADAFLHASPGSAEQVSAAAERMGLQTLLAVMQILDHALGRMRFSTQGRILAELALVSICQLEDLQRLPDLISQLRSGSGNSPARGSSAAVRQDSQALSGSAATAAPSPSQGAPPGGKLGVLTAENAAEVWNLALARMSGMVVEQARQFDHVEASAENHLAIFFKERYALAKSSCERPEQRGRFERALAEVTGQEVGLAFELCEDTSVRPGSQRPATRAPSPQQRIMEIAKHPMVERANQLFGAQPIRVDVAPDPDTAETKEE